MRIWALEEPVEALAVAVVLEDAVGVGALGRMKDACIRTRHLWDQTPLSICIHSNPGQGKGQVLRLQRHKRSLFHNLRNTAQCRSP